MAIASFIISVTLWLGTRGASRCPWGTGALAVALAAVWFEPAVAADAPLVHTWWHEKVSPDPSGPVADDHVRMSNVYDVSVEPASAADQHQAAFVYMSVPRNGHGKQGYMGDDGAEFAASAGLTMSWSSFGYRADTWVYVSISQGPPLASADQVTIRPTPLGFRKELVDDRTIRVLVPYSPEGQRFSVEFDSQLVTSYLTADGKLTTEGAGNRAVHTEPRSALLIFAEPLPEGPEAERLVPDPAKHSIHYPAEGKLEGLGDVTEEVIYFRPGTYYMPANGHAHLSANVAWVYLAPGAYVKGAFQFRSGPQQLRVTGLGVLSGEKYAYEPDKSNGYQHRKVEAANCHGTCVKMLEFEAGPAPQELTLHGVTVANPPYHSFVAYGQEKLFRMHVARYKQVGAWYWQTDGVELYEGSDMSSSFFHSNDDVLKLYASHLEVRDILVWKAENGPVIQWGWAPRNIEDVRVSRVDVIHNRMHWRAHNSCIINSARHYLAPDSDDMADPSTWVRDVNLEDIRSEGKNLCAMRLYALSSWKNIRIQRLWIEDWNELDAESQASRLEALRDGAGAPVQLEGGSAFSPGLMIEAYEVAGERIRKALQNWKLDQRGRLGFDPEHWEQWDAR